MRFGTQPITRPNLSLIILELTDTPDPCSFSFLCQAEHFRFYGAEEHFVWLQQAPVYRTQAHALVLRSTFIILIFSFFIIMHIYGHVLKWFIRMQIKQNVCCAPALFYLSIDHI